MNLTVLMSSGDEDRWENAVADISLEAGGALFIHADEGSENAGEVVAVYAPGMWMKFEVDQDA